MVLFPEQVKLHLISICQLFSSCLQRYALHCSTDGHFAQLIFGADLLRAYQSSSKTNSSPAILELLNKHFSSFEEQLGTYVKVFAFFLRDTCFDQTFTRLNAHERRTFLSNIDDKLQALEYKSNIFQCKEEIDIDLLVNHILNTLPKAIFDRKGFYQNLLCQLIKHNLDRIDDYLVYNQQLSFSTVGSTIQQSRLIDGILLPVHNSQKLLPSFISNSPITVVFLNLDSDDSSFTIADKNQAFLSYDTLVYRQFVQNYLKNVQLIISLTYLNEKFLFELHQVNINVIDSLDDQTFEFLLKVYRCLPCNRLFIADDDKLDKISTFLIDRHVQINQQSYIYLSSNGSHQTLLTCVPTPTLMLTTQKILINIVRLVKYLLEKLKTSGMLAVSREQDYLKFVGEEIPELRHILEHRCIHLAKSDQIPLPVCLFQQYLRNGIQFLCYIHKIDGVHSITKKFVVEKS
ncbi:unnamed protein product [Adineta ricciae]|uniref:Uncharacterized protein n=1 Tax=Adineta ricciae TaxID=249248 RepID=A0A816CT86_ADIRI|nr:unnamed protein product [Adineta ricciae]